MSCDINGKFSRTLLISAAQSQRIGDSEILDHEEGQQPGDEHPHQKEE